VGKPEGRRALGSLRRRWEDNIKMNWTGIGEGDWKHLAQDRNRSQAIPDAVINLRFP
jgi:hypothetical protein